MGELQEQVDGIVSDAGTAVAAATIVQTAEQIASEANARAERAEEITAAIIEGSEDERRNARITQLEGIISQWQDQHETSQAELTGLRLEVQEARTEIARVTGLLEGLTVSLQPEPEPSLTPPASPSPEVIPLEGAPMPSPNGENPDGSPVKNTPTRQRRRFF